MTFLNNLEVTGKLCRFNLLLEGKAGREIPQSSRSEFLEKFSASNFTLSDAKDNISEPLNREGKTDSPLLRKKMLISKIEQLLWINNQIFVLKYAN